jgi:hypothetical protein
MVEHGQGEGDSADVAPGEVRRDQGVTHAAREHDVRNPPPAPGGERAFGLRHTQARCFAVGARREHVLQQVFGLGGGCGREDERVGGFEAVSRCAEQEAQPQPPRVVFPVGFGEEVFELLDFNLQAVEVVA